MANVFLTSEAYAKLKAAKTENESFSDVVLREIKQEVNLAEFLGSCKEMNAEGIVEQIKRDRRQQ